MTKSAATPSKQWHEVLHHKVIAAQAVLHNLVVDKVSAGVGAVLQHPFATQTPKLVKDNTCQRSFEKRWLSEHGFCKACWILLCILQTKPTMNSAIARCICVPASMLESKAGKIC